MPLRMLYWKNLKKRKTFSITILIFMTIVALVLITASTTFYNVNHHMNDMLELNNAPDYMSWIAKPTDSINKQWLNKIEEHSLVDYVEKQPLIGIVSSSLFIQNTVVDGVLYLKAHSPDTHPFQLLYGNQNTLPKQGSVYLPYVFKESYHCDQGDTVTLKFSEHEQTFTIQDFYEDSINGSAMFGLKFILLAQEDFTKLANQTDLKTTSNYTQVNTYLNQTDDVNKAIYELNQDVSLESGSSFTYALSFFDDGSRLVPSLMLLVIMGFSILMFLITLLVLSYALKAAISEDTLEIGIMKAVGFQEKQISKLILLQYGSIALCGLICGALISYPLLTPLEEMVLSDSGLFTSGTPQPWLMLIIGILLMSCIYGMIKYNTNHIRKITCVRALNARNDDVYFSSFLNVSLDRFHFLPINLRLSIKHIITHLKQYTMVIVITLLLSECLLTIMTVNSYFQDEGLASITGGMDTDLYINYSSQEDYNQIPELIQKIEETDPILLTYASGGEHFKVDDTQLYAVYTEYFDEAFATPPLQGRFPKYDNEIMITEMVLDSIQKKVGDTVMISTNDGVEKEFLVVGAHQTFNEMGKQCMMTNDGIERLGLSTLGYRYNIQFKERGQKADLVKTLNEELTENHKTLQIVDEYENVKQYTEAEQIAILAITCLIIILSILFIGLIAFLLIKISMEKEKTELAILKFQGFTVKQLRTQFALRYTIIAMIGSMLGILLNVCTNSQILSALLGNIGVTHFISHYSVGYLIAPIALMMILTYISSILTTRKIKKINVQALTNDN